MVKVMPTDPLQSVLYRELSIAQAKQLIELACPLLQEVINYSTSAFIRCLTSAKGDENEDLAAFALYRHIIEVTDGIEVLVANSCAAAGIPLVRSSFEALLGLEYIVEEPSLYVTRSLSWLAAYVRRKLKFYESLLPTTPRGQEFLKAIDEDKMVKEFTLPPSEDVQSAIDNLRQLLSREQFKPIEEEFAKYRKPPHWYSLFNGPKNLRELANHVKRNAQYEVLYWQWSLATHAQDFSPFIASGPRGEKGIRGIRDPREIKNIATFSSTFLLDATRVLIDTFHPGETWRNWYMREVRQRYMQLVCRKP
jgi:hypothetical protein